MAATRAIEDTSDASHADAFPLSTIKELVASAQRGSLTSSKRGHRIFRKKAGAVCRRAKKELGPAGLLWTKAAWDGSLHAAMAGVEALAGIADAGLHKGFKRVWTSIMQAHLEGLQRPASASCGAHNEPVSPTAANSVPTSSARPPAGGAPRKAREHFARYLVKDQGSHGLYCSECSAPASFARRGGKEGGNLKYFCGVHQELSVCFRIERTRADWARDCEVRKLKAKLARALDDEAQLRSRHACAGRQQYDCWWDVAPKSKNLIAKLLIIGGVESNPGPSQHPGIPSASSGRPLFTIPSWQEVQESDRPKLPDTSHYFEEWKLQKPRSANQPAQTRELEQPIAPGSDVQVELAQNETPAPPAGLPSFDASPFTELLPSPPADHSHSDSEAQIDHVRNGTPAHLAAPSSIDALPSVAQFPPLVADSSEGDAKHAADNRLAEMIAHAKAQMNGPSPTAGAKRPPEQVLPVAGPSRRRRLKKVSEVLAQPAANPLAESAPHIGREVSEDNSSKSSAQLGRSRRGRRRAEEERVVAALFEEHQRRRSVQAAREEEPLTPVSQHDSAADMPDLQPSEIDDAYAGESSVDLRPVAAAEAPEPEPSGEPTPEAAPPNLVEPSASFQGIRVSPPIQISSEPLVGNEVFKFGGYRVVREVGPGTILFHAASAKEVSSLPGPKHFMQQNANLFNHEAQVVLHSRSHKLDNLGRPIPYRNFASFPSWEIAEPHLRGQRHVFEIVRHGFQCKPYLDVDGKDGNPFRVRPDGVRERMSTEDVIRAIEERASWLFESDYGLKLPVESFVWLTSGNQTKFSLHLIINTCSPQCVFASNLEDGAKHFAVRLKEKLKTWLPELAAMIDLSVYSKDREWRAPGCSKVEKPESTLRFLNPAHTWRDGLVTWLEPPKERRVIKLPCVVPVGLPRARRPPEDPLALTALRARGERYFAFVRERMLALLREKLHPTAYQKGPDRYNYTDRSEPCYTGRVHDGNQNLTLHLGSDGDRIFALCFSMNPEGGRTSDLCRSKAFFLGNLYEEEVSFRAGAVVIDMQFLTRDKAASSAEALAEVEAGRAAPSDMLKLNAVIDQWVGSPPSPGMDWKPEFPLLAMRSTVHTNKTGLTSQLIYHELDDAHPGRTWTIALITYRVAQAKDLKKRFPGFDNYLDLKARYPDRLWDSPDGEWRLTALQNRREFPRIVVQVDSLLQLRPQGFGPVAPFDLIVVDEVASILAHLSSSTLRRARETSQFLLELVQNARRVLALDDGYAQREHDFFEMAGLRSKLVINERRAAVPRTYRVTNDGIAWQAQIVEDLRLGRNVAVASMSSNAINSLRDFVLETRLIEESDMLVHTALSSGDETKKLEDVGEHWKVRLLMYSPTIEAGVNFDHDWFYSLYLCMCRKSTTARALWQASLRIRRIERPLVLCFAQPGISLLVENAPLVPRESLDIGDVAPAGAQSGASVEPGVAPPEERTGIEAPPPPSEEDGAPVELGAARLEVRTGTDAPPGPSHEDGAHVESGSAPFEERTETGVPPGPSQEEGAPAEPTFEEQPRVEAAKKCKRPAGMFHPPRPVYLRETMAYLAFCETKRTELLQTVRVRVEDLGDVRVKDDDLLRTLAHTEVEKRNSDSRFLHEFQGQIAKAGHTLEVVLPGEDGSSRRLPESTFDVQRLFRARALGAEEYEVLREKRNLGLDEGDEKLAVVRYECLRFYGLKQVSSWTDFHDFFVGLAKKHIKEPFHDELTFLLKVMLPDRNLEEGGQGTVMHDGVKAKVAREVITAMGLEHPLDMRPTRSLKAEGLQGSLLQTAFFHPRVYSTAGRWASNLFGGIRFPPKGEQWDGVMLRDALNKLFDKMGLQVKRRRYGGAAPGTSVGSREPVRRITSSFSTSTGRRPWGSSPSCNFERCIDGGGTGSS